MSDVDIVIDIATTNVKSVYNLSNALQGLNRVVAGAINPMKNLDARSRALSQAVGSSDGSLKSHAKTLGEVSRNNAILTSELSRVRQELKGLGSSYKFATGTSAAWKNQSLKDLKAYEAGLKQVRIRALTEDLKSLSVEQKRLGKDAQFVGRSLIIGLTTPIMMFSRYALQSLVSVDKEFVRLNKVLESVAPNLDSAAKKMGIDLASATATQNERLNEMVANYEKLDKALTTTSLKFGLSKNIAVGLAGEFAELGIQSTDAIAKITELTAATEKLGDMDIGSAKDLVQSLYFQAVRTMQQSGESRTLPSMEREKRAIAAATAQLNLFNAVENTTALTLRDLGDAFPEVAAAATSFGLSMTETAGLLAPMKAAGFEIGASANSIKVSLQRITAPTKQNQNLFADLTRTYKMNFNLIQGTGVDAIQQLIDAYNTLSKSAAGQEGVMEFFAKVFGVRQGPRMEVAIAQAAEFDRTLKDASISTDRAEKKIQEFANQIISSSNSANKGTLPLINSYKDIAIVARIATAAIDPKKGFANVEGYGAVTQKQIDEAKKVRDQIGKELLKTSQQTGKDLIGQVATETGRAMFVELAGASSAAEVANRELSTALGSLDVQIKVMRNSFKMFATEILKLVAPAIQKLSKFAVKLYDAFMALKPAQKDLLAKMILGFTAAAAAVGPLVFIFGQFRLAVGTAGKVLFGFLPGLKTLSVETLAAKTGMLKLRNGLIAVGDTVYNNNTKFATFIATLASGEGPVAKLATKFGLLTGALKETTTAQTALTTEVMSRQVEKTKLPTRTIPGTRIRVRSPLSPAIGTTGPITGGPAAGVRAIKSLGGGRFEDIADPTRRVTTRAAGAYLEEEASMFARGDLSGTPGSGRFFQRKPVLGRAGATGVKRFIPKRFVATRAISRNLVGEAVATRLQAFEESGITRRVSPSAVGGAALIRRGREISEDRALRIAGGGVRGRVVGALDTLQARGGAAAGAIKGGPATAMTAYRNATAAASKAVQELTTHNLAFGKGAPGLMAKAKVSVFGFAKSFGVVTKAMNLVKIAWIGTGIGVALLAVAAIVYLIAKNFDEFKKRIAPAMESFKAAFNAIKEGAMALIQPFIDLFASIGSGSGDSASQIGGIATAVNILAEVVEFLAKTIKVVFQIIGKIIRYFLGNWVSIFRGIIDIVKGFKKMLSGDLVGGIKQVFGGIAKAVYGLMGPFRFVFDWILKGLILLAKGAAKALGWIPGIGGAVKSAAKGLEKLQGFFKGATNIKASVKVDTKKPIKPEVDTDPAQEKISNATGEGIKEGAEAGAKELAKTLATRLKNLKKELQEEIVNRVKDAMDGVVTSITNSLKSQKEQSLKVYDDQIEKINQLKKTEEELTKTKEYENRKREIEQKRALNALNSQRAYELAIYEGRIDDAREINFEKQKNEQESNKELEDLNANREKEIKDAARDNLIDTINLAKKKAGEYFDDMIDKFTAAAKKITEFPPTTAQEFQTQLEQLGTAAKEAANSIGSNFSGTFTGLLGNLGIDSQGPLTTALEGIGKILTDNNPFGKDGVWQKSIDSAIDYLTRKYDGLYNTLTMVVDTKTDKFKKLFETYNKYQTLVDAETSGGAGGVGGGNAGGGDAGGSAGVQPGYYYRSKEKGQKNWSSWVGPRKLDEINAIKPILSKTGLFEFKFSNYNPGQVNVGVGPGNATSMVNATIRAVGGAIPFMQGGPTNGPIQQGIPAVLHGGEYVVRNSAVKKYGWGMMQQINQGTYKPKPFANGGMVKEIGRQIGQKWTSKDSAAQKEWKDQMAKKYANEEYWLAVGKAETGVDSTGRTPRWKRNNYTGGGGLAISEPTWRDYGGTDFASKPGFATAIQQMVIANRIAFEGYTRRWPVGSPIFPAGMEKFNPPKLGWGVITNGSVPRPEDFYPSTYRSAFGQESKFNGGLIGYAKGGIVDESNPIIGSNKNLFGIGYDKTKAEQFKKYISKGYVNKNGIFISPFGNEGTFRTIGIPGLRWRQEDALTPEGQKNTADFTLDSFNGLEAQWKGGANLGKDFNVWNQRAENIRVGNGGVLEQLKGVGYGLLALGTDLKHSARRAFTGEDIKQIFNPNAPKLARVGSAFNFGSNVLPVLKVGSKLASVGLETAASNILTRRALTQAAAEEAINARRAGSIEFIFDEATGTYRMAGATGSSFVPKPTLNLPTYKGPTVPTINKEPLITEMGSRIYANVQTSRLAREAKNLATTGFAPEYLPVPKGGYRRPKLGGGWQGFAEMERMHKATASAARKATSGPRSVGAAVNPDLMRQTILENIAISRQAREAANKALRPGYGYFAKDIIGEEAKRQMALPEGEILRSIKNRVDTVHQYPTNQETLFGLGGRDVYKPYPSVYPDSMRGASAGGGRSGFYQVTSDAALMKQRVLDNINASKAIREATQIDRLNWFYRMRQITGEELLRENNLPFGQNLRSVRNLRTYRPQLSPSRAGSVSLRRFTPGGGFKAFVQNSESQAANAAIARNRKIRLNAEIAKQKEERAALQARIKANIKASQKDHTDFMAARGRTSKLKPTFFKSGGVEPELYSLNDFINNTDNVQDLFTELYRKNNIPTALIPNDSNKLFSQYLAYHSNIQGTTLREIAETFNQGAIVNEFTQLATPHFYPHSSLVPTKPDFAPWLREILMRSYGGNTDVVDISGNNLRNAMYHAGGAFDMNNAIRQYGLTLPNARTVLRGLYDYGDVYSSLAAGDIIPHISPLRTGLDFYPATHFGQMMTGGRGTGKGFIFAIDTPKGSPYFAAADAGFTHEAELILPGNSLQINKISKIGDNKLVHAQIIQDAIMDGFDISKYTKISGSKGYNPGGVYRSPSGVLFYLKEAQSEAAAINESLAAQLYEYFGSITGEHITQSQTLGQRVVRANNGKTYIASKLNENLRPISQVMTKLTNDIDAQTQLARRYVLDSLLGNYDTIGSNYDNLQFVDTGYSNLLPKTVDTGASLMYRGTGGLKSGRTGIQFTHIVEELDALMTPTYEMHPSFRNAAEFYSSFSNLDSNVRDMIKHLIDSLTIHGDVRLKAIISSSGLGETESLNLFELIKQRIEYMKVRGLNNSIPFGQYNPVARYNGGAIPGFESAGVPALLHGGEYVVNAKAVKNIGFATLQAMNNMRFQKPASPSYSGSVSGQSSSTSTVNIYVDNFIGQKDWFESMMKDYNVTVVPQNQKAAGLENRTIRTYSGINRGM